MESGQELSCGLDCCPPDLKPCLGLLEADSLVKRERGGFLRAGHQHNFVASSLPGALDGGAENLPPEPYAPMIAMGDNVLAPSAMAPLLSALDNAYVSQLRRKDGRRCVSWP